MNRNFKLFLTTSSSALLLTLAIPACDFEEVDEGEFRAIRVTEEPGDCVCIDEEDPAPAEEPEPADDDPSSSDPPGKGKGKDKGNNGKGKGKPPV